MKKKVHQLNFELFKEIYMCELQAEEAVRDAKKAFTYIRQQNV